MSKDKEMSKDIFQKKNKNVEELENLNNVS